MTPVIDRYKIAYVLCSYAHPSGGKQTQQLRILEIKVGKKKHSPGAHLALQANNLRTKVRAWTCLG